VVINHAVSEPGGSFLLIPLNFNRGLIPSSQLHALTVGDSFLLLTLEGGVILARVARGIGVDLFAGNLLPPARDEDVDCKHTRIVAQVTLAGVRHGVPNQPIPSATCSYTSSRYQTICTTTHRIRSKIKTIEINLPVLFRYVVRLSSADALRNILFVRYYYLKKPDGGSWPGFTQCAPSLYTTMPEVTVTEWFFLTQNR